MPLESEIPVFRDLLASERLSVLVLYWRCFPPTDAEHCQKLLFAASDRDELAAHQVMIVAMAEIVVLITGEN